MFGRDKTRMSQWLLLSLLAYVVAAILAGMGDEGLYPRAQTVLWKIGHLNLAAYIGYWIDRNSFSDRITRTSDTILHLRRALIIAAAMIAFGLAL